MSFSGPPEGHSQGSLAGSRELEWYSQGKKVRVVSKTTGARVEISCAC
jgi:hypothetical protein